MSNLLREEVALRNLNAIDVATYLRTHGWERLEHASRDVSYWQCTVAAQRFEVLLPHHHDWSDYLDLLTSLVDVVAGAERRSALSMLRDLTSATMDIVRMDSAKIVYFGPPLSGMSTSIGWIVAQQGVPPGREDTGACMGSVQLTRPGGRTLRLELFRPPMHLYRDPVRTEVLRGVDGVVFVADSQELRGEANVEALEALEGLLAVHGRRLAELPMVLQYNKRDVAAMPVEPPAMLSVEELDRVLNPTGRPRFESIATRGVGVLEALDALADLLVARAGKLSF